LAIDTLITEKARKALREIGLTDYEIRAYLMMLSSGPLTASQVSQKADLPYSKIYDILKVLERKGWIEVERSRPKIYYPKSPSEAIEMTRLRVENSLRNLKSQVLTELKPIYEKRGIQERPDIWIVRGSLNIVSKARETLSRSRRELMLALPFLEKTLINMFTPDLIRMKSTIVTAKLMVTKEVNEDILRKISKLAEIRLRDQMFGGGIISDGKEVMLFLGGNGGEALAIWSDHLGLTKLAKDYFEYLWRDAKPLSP